MRKLSDQASGGAGKRFDSEDSRRRQGTERGKVGDPAISATRFAAEPSNSGTGVRPLDPQTSTIHETFEAQAKRTPEAIALVYEDQRLTYNELNCRANQIAHSLRKLGVGPETLVALCLERSVDLLAALLGVLKAGGAYVPLDPTYPKERLRFMTQDSGVTVLVTQSKFLTLLECDRVLCLDRDREILDLENPDDVVSRVAGENLAYVIYTSGSTGKPKGVLVNHRNVVGLFQATEPMLHFSRDDVWSLFHSYAFDFSVWEIWGALFYGARLVIVPYWLSRSPDKFYKLLCDHSVTILNQTPSAFRQLMHAESPSQGTDRLSLRLIIFGGEALDFQSLKPWMDRHGDQCPRLVNMYGITETTVHVTYRFIRAADVRPGQASLIGTAIHDLDLYLLNENGAVVADGLPGELCVGGRGLARGYLNRPELTTQRFVPDPFDTTGQKKIYRSGDLARRLPNGELEYLGRMDDQVKIRGYRIELGEVEGVLRDHPSVRDAVVVAREDAAGDKQLLAYVVLSETHRTTTSNLREVLQGKLPNYMLPAAIIVLPDIPLTVNGKVDRTRLPLPELHLEPVHEWIPPRTELEKLIASTWSEVLGFARVGAHDNFLDLGGHSIKATQIVSRLRESMNIDLPLAAVFETTDLADLARYVECNNLKVEKDSLGTLTKRPRKGALYPSFAQERAWFIQQLVPDNIAYNFQAALRINGSLQVDWLEKSLNEMVQRHEILRTTFPVVGGRPVQLIHAARPVQIPVIDLSAISEAEQQLSCEQCIQEAIRHRFDLGELPLVRWTLLRLGSREHILVHVEHHVLHDGWSFNVFMREMLELYRAFSRGDRSPLPSLSVQFADFALWQREWLKSDQAEKQRQFWSNKLAGVLPLDLPTDYPRPPVQSFRGAAPRIELPAELHRQLKAYGRRHGATLFVTMLTAFIALLYRYTSQSDISIGSGVANRRVRETEVLLGMLLNNVVLRNSVSGNVTFADLLAQIRKNSLEAFAHQDFPFEKVVEAVQPVREAGRNPLFQVMFSFHDAPSPNVPLSDLTVSGLLVLSNASAKFDLNIIVAAQSEQHVGIQIPEESDGLTMIWEYSTDLFEPATIKRMAGHYETILRAMVADAGRRIADIELLSSEERDQLLIGWNATGREYPRGKRIDELFEAQAVRSAEAVALIDGGERLSYGEVNRRANQVGRYLRERGVRRGSLVGIAMERSVDLIVGILGILKAGGAYVPLDPSYPQERLKYILGDTGAAVILTQQRHMDSLPQSGAEVVCLDRDRQEIGAQSGENLGIEGVAEDLAYVMYTSGSTGVPKGVEVPHRGVVRLLFGVDYVRLDAEQRFLHLAPTSFDASTFEIWGSLLHGGQCVLYPGRVPSPFELGELLHKHEINTLWLTASLFNAVIDGAPEALSGVRQLLIGGEALSVPHVRRALALLPQTQIINGYGPTESTTFTCCYSIPRQLEENLSSIPIGRPIGNTEVYILDSQLHPVPIGVAGELYIGGDGLARGYLNQPELTAEKFIEHPFSEDSQARLYKTGDRVRYLADGNIEFLERLDSQVKIRGYRIELGEIEAVLNEHPGVSQSVVAVREDTPGDKRLVAYVVPNKDVVADQNMLRAHLKSRVPEYMVPWAYVVLDSWPLTANGKVDYPRLPAPEALLSTDEYVAPITVTERRMAELWQKLLHVERIGMHDNFFDLGGHSLLATQLVSRFRREYELEIPVSALFRFPTVSELARHLDLTIWAGRSMSETTVEQTADRIKGEV